MNFKCEDAEPRFPAAAWLERQQGRARSSCVCVPLHTHTVPRVSLVLGNLREIDTLADVVHAVLVIVVAGDLAPVMLLNQILQHGRP